MPEDHAQALEGIERMLRHDDPRLAAALSTFAPVRSRRAVVGSYVRAALLGLGAGLAMFGLQASTSAALHRSLPTTLRLRG
jgi:hypothetical protein